MLDLNELEQLIAFADIGNFVKGGRSIPYFHPISHPFYEKHRRRIWCFPVSPDQKSN